MIRPFLTALGVVALLASPSASFAQTSVGTIPDLVKEGQKLLIIDNEGREVEGRIGRITADTISVSRRGATVDVPLDRIVRIERPDGVRNGMLIGLGFGVTIGMINGALDHQGRGQRATFFAASASLSGLIWMAYGAGIDALVNHRRTIYQRGSGTKARLTPVFGRGAGGAALSLTW